MTAVHVRGRVLRGGEAREIFIVDGRFTFVEQSDAHTLAGAGYIIPGLVDAHAHLGLASPAPRNATPRRRAEASARAHLRSGVLVLREPGGPDDDPRDPEVLARPALIVLDGRVVSPS